MFAQSLSSVILMCCSVASLSPGVVPLDLSQGWQHRTEGAWRIRYDHRELLAMDHPWQPSQEGTLASVSTKITAPAEWKGPVTLHFYCSDDYHTDSWRPDGTWLTAEGFVGHRFKQVLLDGRAVWSQDVSDPVQPGEPCRYKVTLDTQPGRTHLLTLLAFDLVGSETPLPEDFYQSANNEKARDEDPNAARFMTHIYWGDFCLADGDTVPEPGMRPSSSKVKEVHGRRWPLPPFGEPWKGPISLEVSAPKGLPETGFPLQFGIPFAPGTIAACGPLKSSRPNDLEVLSTWPDGSVQWVLLDMAVTPGTTRVEVAFDEQKDRESTKGVILETDQGVTLKVGDALLGVEYGRLLTGLQWKGKACIDAVEMSLGVGSDIATAAVESVTPMQEGTFRSTLLIEGRFGTLERRFARFELTLSAYQGLPFVQARLRVFNDTDRDLAMSSLILRFNLPEVPHNVASPHGPVAPGVVIRQISEHERLLDTTKVDAAAPLYLAWDQGAVTVRQFRELFPKSASVEEAALVFDLAAAGDKPVVFTPGEAKTHEVWFSLATVDGTQFAGTVASPPILQNPDYYCSTGVFGPARTHRSVPQLAEHMRTAFGEKRWEDFGQTFGLRDFPDSPYYGGPPNWSNNYYERMLGLWSEWLMSGDRAWYDLASDVCRHVMDVAVVHSEVPGQDWMGAMHGPGENHVAGPWGPTMRTAGLEIWEKLIGDPEVGNAYLNAADFCARTGYGLGAESVRQQAGPFDAVCTAFLASGDAALMDEGARRVNSILKAMDLRRGAWPEEHGSKVYRGNVPWMVAQIARPLYWWYRATGDIEAAQALVGLAESIICENTEWERPGVVSGYSHNPHFEVSATYDLIILPMLFAAYELTEDAFFLDAAQAQWERWKGAASFDSPLNCYWNTPWLMWCLQEYGLVPRASAAEELTPSEPTAAPPPEQAR